MAWTTVKLYDGTRADLYLQEFESECGPACLSTLGALIGRSIHISVARRWVGQFDPMNGHSFGGHDWGGDGSYAHAVTQALSQHGVRMANTRYDLSQGGFEYFCEQRSTRSPAILAVDWYGGGRHFVVTVGMNNASQQNFIEILDPAYGYQRVAMTDFPEYRVRNQVSRIVEVAGELDYEEAISVT